MKTYTILDKISKMTIEILKRWEKSVSVGDLNISWLSQGIQISFDIRHNDIAN